MEVIIVFEIIFLTGMFCSLLYFIYRYYKTRKFEITEGTVTKLVAGYAGRNRVLGEIDIEYQEKIYKEKLSFSQFAKNPVGTKVPFYVFENQDGLMFKPKYGYLYGPLIIAGVFAILAIMVPLIN